MIEIMIYHGCISGNRTHQLLDPKAKLINVDQYWSILINSAWFFINYHLIVGNHFKRSMIFCFITKILGLFEQIKRCACNSLKDHRAKIKSPLYNAAALKLKPPDRNRSYIHELYHVHVQYRINFNKRSYHKIKSSRCHALKYSLYSQLVLIVFKYTIRTIPVEM
jgi:hypothetical protein